MRCLTFLILGSVLGVLLLVLALEARADDGDAPAWSPPSGMPTPGALPPPRVTDPKAPGRALPAPLPPAAPAAPAPAPVAEPSAPAAMPETAAPSPSAAAPLPMPMPKAPAAAPTAEAPARPTVADLLAAGLTESAVLDVRKRHNQPWHGNWLALELDVLVAAVGQQGREVGASVEFYEEGSGRPLRSRLQPYVDGAGHVSVYTRLVPVDADPKLLRARLKIPYRAFPWPMGKTSYGVEARVRLLRREPAGGVAALARGSTTFTVQVEKDRGAPGRAPGPTRAGARWVRQFARDFDQMFGSESLSGDQPSDRIPPLTGEDAKQWYEWKP